MNSYAQLPSLALAALLALGTLTSCAGTAQSTGQQNAPPESPATPAASAMAANDPYANVNTVAKDRDGWQQLLSDHAAIRRTLMHSEKDGRGIVEATTESDDPIVAARIIEHAKAMQARMKVGAQVRFWDPVFAELFKKHGAVTIDVTPTDKGVKIVESSADPQAVALLRSHAMGVSEFVREGHKAAPRQTPKFKAGDPLPAPELAIGGVPHRFILTQPDAGQLAGLKSAGVDVVINFHKQAEHPEYNEQAAVAGTGMTYCNLAYAGAAEITDELLDSARAAIKAADEKGDTAALHCRTGNRIGPGWAAYRALDKGIPVDQAIAEAKAMQMVDPLMESKTRDYIRRKAKAASIWTPVAPDTLTHSQQAQRQLAIDAKDAMFSRLFAALGEAMGKPGPEGGAAGAIGVCKDQAPKIAQTVAREKGVMIGRTSAKLRNPANAAPSWAVAVLNDQPAEQRLAANTDGSLGVTLPITLAANCLACHGSPDTIDPAVRAALAASYPKDQATSFKEGDLRGWFWVEVPPMTSH
jgi:protein tyrosine phosphatase (PTP) superfamily phosphohydrolase (DUF442 family)